MTQEKSFDKLSPSIHVVLDKIERHRKKYIFAAIWQGFLIGIVLAIIIFIFIGEIFITTILSVFFGIWVMFRYKRGLLSNIYKSEIIHSMVKTLGENMHYSPNDGLNINSFRWCRLFNVRDEDYIHSEDCIHGKIGKTLFCFSESKYGFIRTDSKGDDHDINLFSGIAFEADFNKNFSGVTLLCDKRYKDFRSDGLSSMMLEDLSFNKIFRAYTSDEMESRYILSPSLQERFVRLAESIYNNIGEKKIKVSFYDSRILILISSKKNRFEATILKPLKLERVQEDFKLLHSLTDIVEELNLNTRIWTKQ